MGETLKNIDTKLINKNTIRNRIVSNNNNNNNNDTLIVKNTLLLDKMVSKNESDIVTNKSVQKGTNVFSDFGKQVYQNTPMLTYESIKDIRMDCTTRTKNAEYKKTFIDDNDREYYDVNDIIELLSFTLTLCEKYKYNEKFDSNITAEICVSYYKAVKNYEDLFSKKGWKL